jgi:hypothetical protein
MLGSLFLNIRGGVLDIGKEVAKCSLLGKKSITSTILRTLQFCTYHLIYTKKSSVFWRKKASYERLLQEREPGKARVRREGEMLYY